MAAGLGFKTFNTGDVLTAGDTNGYLMQGVWVFASAAARTSAVTSPQEGNVSFLKDTNSLEIYDGAAWVAYGSGDITGVTAGTGISGGGTSGTVTVTNSMATAIDAKGDIIAGTGADTFDRLAVGTNGQILSADSTATTGLKWITAAASGKLLQVVQTTKSDTFSTNSASYVDVTGLSASITPSSASSKILVLVQYNSSASAGYPFAKILRGSTDIYIGDASGSRTRVSTAAPATNGLRSFATQAIHYLDSPATTSSTTYKLQMLNSDGGTSYVNRSDNDADSSTSARGISSIILLEIGA